MYSDILKKVMGVSSLENVCIKVDLKNIVYPLSFIFYENHKYLVIDTTGDDGRERKVIIPKSEIIAISVVYQQDIECIFDEPRETDMFS